MPDVPCVGHFINACTTPRGGPGCSSPQTETGIAKNQKTPSESRHHVVLRSHRTEKGPMGTPLKRQLLDNQS